MARGSLEETHSCAIAKEGYVLALSFLVATTFELEGPAFSFRFASRNGQYQFMNSCISVRHTVVLVLRIIYHMSSSMSADHVNG